MSRKGFTLIELLVVITILAILAGAALPYVQNYVSESKIAKAKTDLEEISRAIAVYETREGDYAKDNVSDLTGRYLNKAPIDPWGKPYYIATASGLVVSGGPDRDNSTSNDNITAPYQPPLALVSVKWVDKNQSGAVDFQNVPDQLQINFSRLVNTDISVYAAAGDWNKQFQLSNGKNFEDVFDVTPVTGISWIASPSRTLIVNVASVSAFIAGADTLTVMSAAAGDNKLVDFGANKCISDQPVKILPQ